PLSRPTTPSGPGNSFRPIPDFSHAPPRIASDQATTPGAPNMRFISALSAAFLFAACGVAGEVEIAGMKSKTPDSWKEERATSEMRLAQFKLPKAEGDSEDAELIIFYFKGGSGTAEQNMARQLAKFKPAEGKEKVEAKMDKIKVGK